MALFLFTIAQATGFSNAWLGRISIGDFEGQALASLEFLSMN
jgi:hypothetical protein